MEEPEEPAASGESEESEEPGVFCCRRRFISTYPIEPPASRTIAIRIGTSGEELLLLEPGSGLALLGLPASAGLFWLPFAWLPC
jgi:hypothetical protein